MRFPMWRTKKTILLLLPVFALAFAGCGGGGGSDGADGGSAAGGSAGSGAITTSADTTRPSTPIGLTATMTTSTEVGLSWNASSDNVGVTDYVIRRNGTLVGTSSTTTYLDAGLTAGTNFSYTVA